MAQRTTTKAATQSPAARALRGTANPAPAAKPAKVVAIATGSTINVNANKYTAVVAKTRGAKRKALLQTLKANNGKTWQTYVAATAQLVASGVLTSRANGSTAKRLIKQGVLSFK